jgi:phosphatidylserine decarboxylase
MIHREGYVTIALTLAVLLPLNLVAGYAGFTWTQPWLGIVSAALLGIVLQFFRNPARPVATLDNHLVYSPADGKVVVIEEIDEDEYFKDRRLMVSVFMSPINVHANRTPFSGKVAYRKYHPGKYLVAWHPKSSTENERMTAVIDGPHGQVLLRQIAGALARRIVNYLEPGQEVRQGQEMGFIKFGSRVDVFLPLNAEVLVQLGQNVKGNVDVLARLNA